MDHGGEANASLSSHSTANSNERNNLKNKTKMKINQEQNVFDQLIVDDFYNTDLVNDVHTEKELKIKSNKIEPTLVTLANTRWQEKQRFFL